MNKKLIFFKGIYDTLDQYTDEFTRIYEAKGYECLVMNAKDMQAGLTSLAKFISTPVTAVITLNNMGFNMELVEGKNIWDELGIPCINILMDHPFHYQNALAHAPKQAILLCMDRKHVDYVRRFYKNIEHVGFLPHAGSEQKCVHRPLAERSIDVLYAGGLSKYVAQGLVPDLGEFADFDAFELSRQVLQELASHPHRTTEEVIEEYLLGIGMHYTDEELNDIISRLRFLDSYAVSFYREQAVKNLVERGIRVHVYGAGWNQCEWADNPNLIWREKVPATEIPAMMNDSKIVLNTMTWFKDGTHDRVFNGMLAGALVVTDDSIYMREHFQSGRELIMFDLQEMNSMADKVSELLGDISAAQKIAEEGYRVAREAHTWEVRADEIEKQWFS